MKQFERPVMFVPEEAGDWKVESWNSNPQPIEREVKNMTINFGPQHPAAHGVLRLVLELAGEVKLICQNQFLSVIVNGILLNFRLLYEQIHISDFYIEALKN